MLGFLKKKHKDKVLVRICIGCVLPHNAKLIGKGTYSLFITGKGKIDEQHYDYEINEEDLDDFLKINKTLLIKYQLLDIEKEVNEEDKKVVKPTTLRGWAKKNYPDENSSNR